MKLRNWLPTKYLTEENPVIGLSFEVGYARIAVMVGQTIIHTMSNMIRADYDSQIFHCTPAYIYRSYMSDAVLANKHHPMEGGFRRQDTDKFEVHSALTPRFRSAVQYTGLERYRDFDSYSAQLLELRRNQKAANPHPDIVEIDRMHRFLNSPYLYQSIGSMGHVDYDRAPSYLTHALYEKEMRQAAVEAGFGELDYMQRKLLNNGHSGVPRKESGHSSMTAACRTVPKYRLTDMHGDRGVAPKVKMVSTHGGRSSIPMIHQYLHDVICYKAAARINEKYYFTGVGMLPKDL